MIVGCLCGLLYVNIYKKWIIVIWWDNTNIRTSLWQRRSYMLQRIKHWWKKYCLMIITNITIGGKARKDDWRNYIRLVWLQSVTTEWHLQSILKQDVFGPSDDLYLCDNIYNYFSLLYLNGAWKNFIRWVNLAGRKLDEELLWCGNL